MKTVIKEDHKFVKDCMTPNAEYIQPDTTIQDAAKKMVTLDTGSLPIGDGDKLLGFITDRDITIRAVAQGFDPENTPVEKIMTKQVLYCYEDQKLEEVAENMRQNNILRLVVLDKNKRFVGVITHSDIAKAISKDDSELCLKVAELASFQKAA